MYVTDLYVFLNKTTVNTAGVVLAAVGACLLWYFVGEVTSVNRKEILAGKMASFTVPTNTPELRRHIRIHIWLSRLGVFLTIAGGTLQVVSNYLPE